MALAGLVRSLRHAAAPRAALRRYCSSPSAPSPQSAPSSSATDYKYLVEKIDALQADQTKIKEKQLQTLALLEKSAAQSKETVKLIGIFTGIVECALIGLSVYTVYIGKPERPSPTKVTAEAAKTTAEAAKTAAEAAKTAAEAAKTTAEATKTSAEPKAAAA